MLPTDNGLLTTDKVGDFLSTFAKASELLLLELGLFSFIKCTMNLPTREEINVYDSLDERTAVDHFLGKTLEQAEQLFQKASMVYQEDLMWMGPAAFRFYVPAAIRYIQSEASTGDSDMINCFAGVLEFRLEHEREELRPIAEALVSACSYIMEHYERFDETPDIYGVVRARFIKLRQTLSEPL